MVIDKTTNPWKIFKALFQCHQTWGSYFATFHLIFLWEWFSESFTWYQLPCYAYPITIPKIQFSRKKLTVTKTILQLWPVVYHSVQIRLTLGKLRQWLHNVIITSFLYFCSIFLSMLNFNRSTLPWMKSAEERNKYQFFFSQNKSSCLGQLACKIWTETNKPFWR